MIKKIILFIFLSFIAFLLFYERSTTNLEGNNWIAEKVIINNKDYLKSNSRIIFPTKILINEWIDSLIILNPNLNLSFNYKIEKNNNFEIVKLNSKNKDLNDVYLLKLDTIDDKFENYRTIIVNLKSKKSEIIFYHKFSNINIPTQPRKPVRGLP